MITAWIRKPAMLGLTLSATLAAALAGCGGGPTNTDDAVVATDPTVRLATKSAATSTTGASTAGGAGSTAGGAAAPASASTAPVKAEGWGTLKGQILWGGDTPPPPKVLEAKGKAEKNPDICAVKSSIVSERLIVDPASKGVKNVIVYLPKPTAINQDAKKAVAAVNVVFDQNGCVFEPHVLALMAGVPITLNSGDATNHNVHVNLKNTLFNSTVGQGKPVSLITGGAERTPGSVVCDIHPWMMAWWMVLDHPYFAVTDANGYYEIKNAPAGTQKVVVWQEAAGFVTAPSGEDVTIKASDATVKDFTISKVRPE
jgi:plastocyanin